MNFLSDIRTRTLIATSTGVGLLAVGLPVALATSASADTEKRGSCSASAVYDYEVEKDDGGFEVSFEVDTNVAGQRWRVNLFHDGDRYYKAVGTTDREGEVDAEAFQPNTAGQDRFRAKARNLSSGEVCKVTITRR